MHPSSDPHSHRHRRRTPQPPSGVKQMRSNALERLKRAHRNRARVVRDLNILIPARVLERHPDDLAWRVSVMDRWIARHLDLAGGRRLPPWAEDEDEGTENPSQRIPQDPDDTPKESS